MSSPTTGPDLHSWYASVGAVLAKAARKDPSEMPEDAWRELVETTRDGIEVNPLYTRADETPERPAPGAFPFVRGGDRSGLPDNGWHVSARVEAEGDPSEVNTAVLDLLGQGASALWLQVGAPDVAAVLKDVYLDLAPVTFDAGADLVEVTDAFLELLDRRRADGDGVTDRAAVIADLGAAPVTTAYGDGAAAATATLEDAVHLASRVSDREETLRTFVADGTVFHADGAGDAQELAYAVAAGLEYVRALMSAGLPAEVALRQISFRLAATDDQFVSIAKFRAGRLMWARVAELLDAPDAGNAPQHAVTSSAMMARRDPWVNMLRTTLAAFGAGVGGATSVTVLPFDVSVPGGLESTSGSFAERIARNTQLLLLEESHLGHVVDPAGGSWYVESLTDSLADAAWSALQTVEAEGGLAAAIASGSVADAIARVREARDSDIAHRSAPITGVSEFPNLAEQPLDASRRGGQDYRYGRDFEDLRDRSDAHLEATGSRPAVLLAGLGPQAETTGRVTFIANLLAAGGVEARNPGVTAADQFAGAHEGEEIAVLCGGDKRYASEGPGAVRALRDAGVTTVYLAGAEKGFPVDAEDRPDGYLSNGIDAVAALTTLLDQLGVK
ncbi:methylmalonyl-CoA mutase family protein [Dietzia sp. PP-33]|uniref:methylmalonyl-CoA mutase family protein n=1 Tax=Dietzia sp. PP-33 TaxID=2957500 RepID=UPI0029BA8B36|nr:methylmalonyl-CoA mutase family protein [Dietzia sp. PP-33]MDX2355427.1 methylmalonyl-CoA mutase family protein [Dietzia sp. PP-33]